MRLLFEILAVYFIYACSTAFLVIRFGTKDPVPSVAVAWLAPAIIVASIISTINTIARMLAGLDLSLKPCPEGLEEAEQIVETKRHAMFGGAMRKPHFAADWAKVYELAVELQAERVQRLARKLWTASSHGSVNLTRAA
jgi:hypothetical protein